MRLQITVSFFYYYWFCYCLKWRTQHAVLIRQQNITSTSLSGIGDRQVEVAVNIYILSMFSISEIDMVSPNFYYLSLRHFRCLPTNHFTDFLFKFFERYTTLYELVHDFC